MTDNEIIKALECCQKVKGYRHTPICQECPLCEARCAIELPKIALDLINRQKAEIERLEKEREAILSDIQKALDGMEEVCILYAKEIARAKAEAVKEFAREIFAEIERAALHMGDFEVKVFEVVAPGEVVERVITGDLIAFSDIAELKNKYTEVKDND